MKTGRFAFLTAGLLLGWFAENAWSSAQPNEKTFKIDTVKFGTLLTGPALADEDTRDRVVVIAFWNSQQWESLHTLSQLTRWRSRHAGTRLLLVAAHVDAIGVKPTPGEQQIPLVEPRGPRWSVVEKVELPTGLSALPGHCLIFDHIGRLVYRGPTPSSAAEHALQQSVNKAPLVLVDPNNYQRLLPLVTAINTGHSPATIAAQLRGYFDNIDPFLRQQSREMLNRINGGVVSRIRESDALKSSDPIGAQAVLELVVRNFGNVDAYAEAKKKLEDLKADLKFQRDRRAAELLEQLRGLEATLRSPGKDWKFDPKDAEFQRVNKAGLTKMRSHILVMKQGAPDALATAEALKIADYYGMELETVTPAPKPDTKADPKAAAKAEPKAVPLAEPKPALKADPKGKQAQPD